MTTYVLLSAGIGRSMKARGAKSLLKFDNMTVLDYQIKTIKEVDPTADICVVVGFQAEKIIKRYADTSIRFIQNANYEKTHQCESIKLAINATNADNVFIIHGDVIFNKSAISRQDATYVVADNNSDKRKMGLCGNADVLANMAYGLEEKWGQILFIQRKDFPLVRSLINNTKPIKATFEFINTLNSKIDIKIHRGDDIKIMEISKTYEDSDGDAK
jgi:CTP:phosphocholine cytidylyltransferase-like protein